MQITIFKELTTEDYLVELENKAAEYEGLYVDMNNAAERKFVKDKAHDIQQLLKKIDRKRIDESKEYKLKVEAEAKAISERLESANAPFQFLIDQHKAERAKILAAEKAEREAIELAQQIEVDHEDAINLNKLFDLEKAEEARKAKEEHDKMVAEIAEQERVKAAQEAERMRLELEAVKQKAIDDKIKAEQAEAQRKIDQEKAIEQAKVDAENKAEEAKKAEQLRVKLEAERIAKEEADKLANIEYVTGICTQVKESLMSSAGLTEEQAVSTVKAIRKGLITHTSIKF